MDIHDSKLYLSDLDTAISATIELNRLNGRSVLITGATGTIGSFVVDMLIRYNQTHHANIWLYIAGRNVQKLEQLYGGHVGCEIVPYEMKETVKLDFASDFIIHIAGNAHPAAFNQDPVGTVRDSINSTYQLLEYGHRHGGKRLLYVSSGEVYGESSLDELEEDYAGYMDTLSPRSCYPIAKRASENLCASYTKQYGLETVIVRPCHTYGPYISQSDNRAHAQFIQNALCGKDIVLKSAGAQMRSYSYVADSAAGLLTSLIRGKAGEAYNLANPNARCTIAQLAEVISRKVGRNVIFAEPDAVDMANRSPIQRQVLSSKKLEALGWKGSFSVDKGIEHTLQIMQESRESST